MTKRKRNSHQRLFSHFKFDVNSNWKQLNMEFVEWQKLKKKKTEKRKETRKKPFLSCFVIFVAAFSSFTTTIKTFFFVKRNFGLIAFIILFHSTHDCVHPLLRRLLIANCDQNEKKTFFFFFFILLKSKVALCSNSAEKIILIKKFQSFLVEKIPFSFNLDSFFVFDVCDFGQRTNHSFKWIK